MHETKQFGHFGALLGSLMAILAHAASILHTMQGGITGQKIKKNFCPKLMQNGPKCPKTIQKHIINTFSRVYD